MARMLPRAIPITAICRKRPPEALPAEFNGNVRADPVHDRVRFFMGPGACLSRRRPPARW